MRTLRLRWSAEVSPSHMSCFHVLTAGQISATSRCLPAPPSTCQMVNHHHRSSSFTPFLTTLPPSLEILPAVSFAFKHFPRLNSKPTTFRRPRNNAWPQSPPYMNSCYRLRFLLVPLGCLHFTHTCSTLLFHGRPCIFSARHTQRNWQLSPPPFHPHTHLRLCVHYPRPRLSPQTFSLSFSNKISLSTTLSHSANTLPLSASLTQGSSCCCCCSTYCLCCSCCALPCFGVSRCRPTSTLSAKSLPLLKKGQHLPPLFFSCGSSSSPPLCGPSLSSSSSSPSFSLSLLSLLSPSPLLLPLLPPSSPF
jgi:hypothetical protein